MTDPLVRYRSLVYDSLRWEGVDLRPGDIIISTPPKCGTTWTQMICALLILQTPELPARVSDLSPWVDQENRSRAALRSLLEAQEHRRFLKTHTPLDGLPRRDDVTYLCVGRDPRDVALSWDHHLSILQIEQFLALRAEAAAEDGIELPPVIPPPERPEDPVERFWFWVDNDNPSTATGSSLRRTLEHLDTFWTTPDLDVVLLHYDDLQADLGGEMRRLAERLGIDVPERAWPPLVEAATFAAMRDNAEVTAPSGGGGQWSDDKAFFHKGTSGQWREILSDPASLARYRDRVDGLSSTGLAAWTHGGWPP